VRVASGDPTFDARIVVYGEDAAAVRRVLAAPGLRAAMLAVAELDLYVGRERVLFADPRHKNVRADGGTRLDQTAPAHDRIADVLARAIAASR
jgi:hypothetical protein